MLKNGLGNEELLRGRALSRLPNIDLQNSSSISDDDDDIEITNAPSFSSISTAESITSAPESRRFRGRSLSCVERIRRPRNTDFADTIFSVGSSASAPELSIEDGTYALPSATIRNLFQKSAPTTNGRGGALVKKLIEEQQAKVCHDKEDDCEKEEAEQDLRAIYQRYLSGEKESVLRSGSQWTSGYGDRRRQRAHLLRKKISRNAADGKNPAEVGEELTAVERRNRKTLIPVEEMATDHHSKILKQRRRARYSL